MIELSATTRCLLSGEKATIDDIIAAHFANQDERTLRRAHTFIDDVLRSSIEAVAPIAFRLYELAGRMAYGREDGGHSLGFSSPGLMAEAISQLSLVPGADALCGRIERLSDRMMDRVTGDSDAGLVLEAALAVSRVEYAGRVRTGPAISSLGIAGMAVHHFGNPIPKAAYSAAKDAMQILDEKLTVPVASPAQTSTDRTRQMRRRP
ncbi:hypothetical protein [Paucibacter soli]|uniref:hypothetical protein n=1 Tax=Paucibacter soli TaxID=3133433 RepID=UPI0030AE1C05